MKVARLLGFLLAALILIPMAHADGNPVTMVFQDVNGANDGQYYVSPYTGTMNTHTVTLFCDDVLNEVNFGQRGKPTLPISEPPSKTTTFHKRDMEELPPRWFTAMPLRFIRKPHGSPHNSDIIPITIRICNTRCGS